MIPPERKREYNRRYREKHQDQLRAYNKQYLKKHPNQQKDNSKRLRKEVIDNYEGSCQCCGEVEAMFLAIDPINGVKTRGAPRTGASLWPWLTRNTYPEGFRVLCFNCNFAVARGRVCPHQQIKECIA